jgi:hypothetical protein
MPVDRFARQQGGNMTIPSPIFILAIVTMVSAVAFGIWQLRRVEKAKERRETSALGDDRS